jgi:hypothetical protein
MIMREQAFLRLLCAALAALLALVSVPAAAAFNACDDRGGSCLVACDEVVGDRDPGGEADGPKGCTHCAFGHLSHSIPAPAGDDAPARFDPPREAYLAYDDAWAAFASRDGPEHPPKA